MPKTIFRALAALATLGLLTGCASDVADDAPEAELTVTQTPERTEPEVVLPGNGETLTTQEQIAAARGAGFGIYEMADGTKVAIDPEQPLPQPVIDDGVAGAQARWQTDMMEAEALASAFVRATKHNIAFIIPIYGSKEYWEDPSMLWVVAGVTNPQSPLYADNSGYPGSTADVNAQVAWAEQWVATRPASENWQIVVTPTP